MQRKENKRKERKKESVAVFSSSGSGNERHCGSRAEAAEGMKTDRSRPRPPREARSRAASKQAGRHGGRAGAGRLETGSNPCTAQGGGGGGIYDGQVGKEGEGGYERLEERQPPSSTLAGHLKWPRAAHTERSRVDATPIKITGRRLPTGIV